MFLKPAFYGSVTVGERGQVVLPAKVRTKFNINPGDKLLVLAPENSEDGWAVMLVDSDVLSNVFSNMSKDFGEILEDHASDEKGGKNRGKGKK